MAKYLNPIRPSAAIRAKYERRILALVADMQRNIAYRLRVEYRQATPAITIYAMDASPARRMQSVMDKIRKRWLGRFDELAPKMAAYFAQDVKDRCERTLKADLREAGMSVRFTMTRAMNDAFQAVKAENVGLIRSIAEQHLSGVETLVMQSVQRGRDLSGLAKGLEERYGVTKRRAARIALDQSNKATATIQQARQLSLGITEGEWLHSAGGKIPRPQHVAFSGKRFNLAKGHDFGDGEGPTLPGQPINCRCVWKAVIPGFDD